MRVLDTPVSNKCRSGQQQSSFESRVGSLKCVVDGQFSASVLLFIGHAIQANVITTLIAPAIHNAIRTLPVAADNKTRDYRTHQEIQKRTQLSISRTIFGGGLIIFGPVHRFSSITLSMNVGILDRFKSRKAKIYLDDWKL